MPAGKGTYGNKVGRPKKTKATPLKAGANGYVRTLVPKKTKKKKK